MAALYLGSIGGMELYDIYAFTKDLPFMGYPISEISDEKLFHVMQRERYDSIIERQRAIYCTAINLDRLKRIETNPHDDREGAVHIVAIHKETGEASCFLSVAIDIPETYHGRRIGLPMENRLPGNGYSEGANLDRFREKYHRVRRNRSPKGSFMAAELFRHFRTGGLKDIVSRFGCYVGVYHLLVRQPRNIDKLQIPVWVFDAKANLFDKYRWAGGAVLRDLAIADQPRFVSPFSKNIETVKLGDYEVLMYEGEIISRNMLVPIPLANGILEKACFPFLDGVIDVNLVEDVIKEDPTGLLGLKHKGMSDVDMYVLTLSQSVFGKRLIDQEFSDSPEILKFAKENREMIAPRWNFNGVGV